MSAALEAKPKRRGRPRSAAAKAVRIYSDAILRHDVNVAQIAELCGVHPTTVYRWLKADH